jgi:hypothetical protein
MNNAKPNPKPSAAQAPAKAPATQEPQGLGPEHAELAKSIGTWDVAVTVWAKEGAPPVTSNGRSIFTPIFNGRFIREDFTGTFMGKPFTGVGTLGFDRAAGQYVSVWFDNVGTGIMHSTADPGPAGDDLIFKGVGVSQETMTVQALRHILRWESDTSFTLSFFKGHIDDEGDGEDEVQSMELVYSRRS